MDKKYGENFLLTTDTAKELFFGHAKELPIIDYHCHVNPMHIAQDHHFEDITEVLISSGSYGDHYKWRLLRANGVPESSITGSDDGRTKFRRYAELMPKIIGNPLYQWTHLELKTYFGFDGILCADNADYVYDLAGEALKTMSVRQILKTSKVQAVATTDDPADDLEAHKLLRADASCETLVVPTWRPDKLMNINKAGFAEYIAKLSEAAGVAINGLESLEKAISVRMDLFNSLGCRASDHGLDEVPFAPAQPEEVENIFKKALAGESVSAEECEKYKFFILHYMGEKYCELGWAMQLHYGAVRNANSRAFELLGADTGYDSMGPAGDSRKILAFLDSLEKKGKLPKTILYSLNNNDNRMLVAAAYTFPGKIQHGCPWWFNDTYTGMRDQLICLAEGGVLGNFIGMLTDSRSFTAYPRHELFRRILCQLLGEWSESGEFPIGGADLAKIAEDISYYNCKNFFNY